MTYAEAIERMGLCIKELHKRELTEDYSIGSRKIMEADQSSDEEALAVLRRAGKVMSAIEADDSIPSWVEVQLRAHFNNTPLETILRACAEYRKGEK